MTDLSDRWAGIDVGASKGFDLAVIDGERLVAGPNRIVRIPDVVRWLQVQRPAVIAVDCPRSSAPADELSRQGERELVRARVCGIRYTPNEATLEKNKTYYAWIKNGFKLYAALIAETRDTNWDVIECFPTATWSRLGGPRDGRSRARWSREVLGGLGLGSLQSRMNQDARDAIGAAITARLYNHGDIESFGDIVAPVDPTLLRAGGSR
jgi:predicted nuclease with RNAse H fold